jgi:putative hydrolase of HD superfamily
MKGDRLERQIRFILEIDRLKGVLRQSYLAGVERRESSAEHSWHLAMMALVLAEHANAAVEVSRVMRMLLVHDIVEVDAGDTYVYDPAARAGQAERERRAADRLFGLLPDDQGRELRALWKEFEGRASPEARFAAALDRLMPVLHNCFTSGRSWREHGVTADLVIERNQPMREGSETLWTYALARVRAAVERGDLAPIADAGPSV